MDSNDISIKKTRKHFKELMFKIEKMDHLSSAEKFELQMMANCALMVEEFLIRDGVIFNLDFVSSRLGSD